MQGFFDVFPVLIKYKGPDTAPNAGMCGKRLKKEGTVYFNNILTKLHI